MFRILTKNISFSSHYLHFFRTSQISLIKEIQKQCTIWEIHCQCDPNIWPWSITFPSSDYIELRKSFYRKTTLHKFKIILNLCKNLRITYEVKRLITIPTNICIIWILVITMERYFGGFIFAAYDQKHFKMYPKNK